MSRARTHLWRIELPYLHQQGKFGLDAAAGAISWKAWACVVWSISWHLRLSCFVLACWLFLLVLGSQGQTGLLTPISMHTTCHLIILESGMSRSAAGNSKMPRFECSLWSWHPAISILVMSRAKETGEIKAVEKVSQIGNIRNNFHLMKKSICMMICTLIFIPSAFLPLIICSFYHPTVQTTILQSTCGRTSGGTGRTSCAPWWTICYAGRHAYGTRFGSGGRAQCCSGMQLSRATFSLLWCIPHSLRLLHRSYLLAQKCIHTPQDGLLGFSQLVSSSQLPGT